MIAGVLGLAAWGCATGPSGGVSSSTPAFVTVTLPPTAVPSPTPISPSSTPDPTATPRPGITSTQLYVRAGPDAASKQLGLLGAASAVQILGQDPTGSWYEIAYSQGDQGMGWIYAQYVQVTGKDTLPVIGVTTNKSPGGTVTQQVNVRSGPGTTFESLGTLDPGTAVTPTGKDSSGGWLQIRYPVGSDGTGWVAAQYVQTSGLDELPVLDETGQAAGTATPATPDSQPTPTPPPAPADGDSLDSPAVDAVFSPAGSGSIIYTNDVSAPGGEATDWIGFTPYGSSVLMHLSCSGGAQLSAELLHQGKAVGNWGGLACGQAVQPSLAAGQLYVLQLRAAGQGDARVYVRYTLTIEGWR
jgi:uncharacterized protein YraI